MMNRLEPIIEQKQREVTILKKFLHEQPEHQIQQILQNKIEHRRVKNFKQAIKRTALSVIAEIKRRSPSEGQLADIRNPVTLAQQYITGGANAISVLTDEIFFAGNLNDLLSISKLLENLMTPILRKDFIIDETQIAESVYYGADAILLIVAALGERTKILLDKARHLGLAALVEINNQAELDIALNSGAEIIAVNNRDLKTFTVHSERAFELIKNMPENIVKVAASGIHNALQAKEYYQAGFDAVLIGEALVKSTHPDKFIRACKHE